MTDIFKRIFCKHSYDLNRWHISHGQNGMDPAEIEAEYICINCGNVTYGYYPISRIREFESIAPQYERRLNNEH